ncbi:MAG: alanine racemase [Pseudomonadales bacterium]
MKRRSLLTAAPALAGAGLLWMPGARSQTHDKYFIHLNQLLKSQGPGRPVMLLDRQRIDHNIDRIKKSVGNKKRYRVVVKSLPSVPLLEHVMQRADTNALMVFHQPFLNEVATAFPSSDVLLGKPMPVQAARTFYQKHNGAGKFDPATQVQWLIDSHERLLQYHALARQLGVQMGINFEIDVGLKRGGFVSPAAMQASLKYVLDHPEHLSVRGLMGYEPQLTGLKADLTHPQVQEVLGIYRSFIEQLKSHGLDPSALTLNGAGSHTLKIYEQDDTMNDLSAGSGVVMPTDFDTHHLLDHLPGLFIATPILKRYDKNPVMVNPPEDMQRVYYIYGGYWKAEMVSPFPIGKPIYESTNQSPITTSANVDLKVDDYMFLRPTQSEFVMLQFGDLLVIDNGELTDTWPVFQQTG